VKVLQQLGHETLKGQCLEIPCSFISLNMKVLQQLDHDTLKGKYQEICNKYLVVSSASI
jgi:hypothetical protein